MSCELEWSKPALSLPPSSIPSGLTRHFSNPTLTVKSNSPFNSLSTSCCYNLKCSQTFSASASSDPNLLFHNWPQLLKFSIESDDFTLAQAIHAFLVKSNSQNEVFLGNNLVNLYSKLNRLEDAQRVFDKMLVRNIVTWTTLMKGYLENGDFELVLRFARDMYHIGEKFNGHTCSVVLQACESLEDQILGEEIHAFIIKVGYEENVLLGTSLVSMYSRSGSTVRAEKVFNHIKYNDLRCINFMILEYGNAGKGAKAVDIFVQFLNSGLQPNDYTFTNIISAMDSHIGLDVGKQVHGLAVKFGVTSKTCVANAVITMYGKHGMLAEAEKMFFRIDEKSLITWSALLSAYVKCGNVDKALDLFSDMLETSMHVDSICLNTILDGCSECQNREFGHQVHGLAIKLGYVWDLNMGTALIDFYAKCGNLRFARVVFDRLPSKTTASFNAVLAGYLKSNNGDEEENPLAFFDCMRCNGVKPDMVTFSQLLCSCADQACLNAGRSVHACTIKTGNEADTAVGNALITMYAKCGIIEDAYEMFSVMSIHDLVTWNAVVSACALNGEGVKALSLFEAMKEEGGFDPDKITLLAVLQACSYSGQWEKGFQIFQEMESRYRIKPVIEHFACVVDILGRAGRLLKAMETINSSPFSNSPLLWRTLVNACKLYGDLQVGIAASKKLLDLEPSEASAYILVSNMYEGGGMLEEAAKIRTTMNDLKLVKEMGLSWIEINGRVHYFVSNYITQPESKEIYALLDLLGNEMQRESAAW